MVVRRISIDEFEFPHSFTLPRSLVRTSGKFGHLHGEIFGGVGGGRILKDRLRRGGKSPLEIGNGEQNLHDRVHIAGVAQVVDAGESWSELRRQLRPALLNRVVLHLLIQVDLQLDHRLFRFRHLRHVDAPVGEMFGEFGIDDHVVFVVGEHVGAVGRDRPQFDGQRIFGLVVIFDGVIVAARTVEELPTAEDGAVS